MNLDVMSLILFVYFIGFTHALMLLYIKERRK